MHSGGVFNNNELRQLSEQIQSSMTQVQQQVQQQNHVLSRQLCSVQQTMAQDMGYIKQSLNNVHDCLQTHGRNIQQLQDKLRDAESNISKLQSSARRKNIKITGVSDVDKETTKTLTDTVIHTLNKYTGDSTYSSDMIEDAHRVGRRGRYPRPIIVQFSRYDVTMKAMTNQTARKAMFADNIKISADLTPEQQEAMQELRRNGQTGILKNGRVVPVDGGRHQFRRYGPFNDNPSTPNSNDGAHSYQRSTNANRQYNDQQNNDGDDYTASMTTDPWHNVHVPTSRGQQQQQQQQQQQGTAEELLVDQQRVTLRLLDQGFEATATTVESTAPTSVTTTAGFSGSGEQNNYAWHTGRHTMADAAFRDRTDRGVTTGNEESTDYNNTSGLEHFGQNVPRVSTPCNNNARATNHNTTDTSASGHGGLQHDRFDAGTPGASVRGQIANNDAAVSPPRMADQLSPRGIADQRTDTAAFGGSQRLTRRMRQQLLDPRQQQLNFSRSFTSPRASASLDPTV